MLAPVLARLDGIDGVERSYSNRTGTLLRLSVAPSADKDRVAAEAARALGDEQTPTPLVGVDLDRALAEEEWRDAGRVGELSAIEYLTLALRGLACLAAVLAIVCGAVLLGRRLRRARRAARPEGGPPR